MRSTSFAWIQTAIPDEVSNDSFKSARSVCAVSRSVVRSVLRSSCSAGNVLNNPRETWLEQHFHASDRRSKAHCVATRRLYADIRFRSRLLQCTPHTTWEQTIIKHILPAPLLETSTFGGVSLKTLLVLPHRRILRPSLSAAWRISGSPNLIIASRNGLRRPS